MPAATRSIVIDAPIEKVFATVTDYAKYPEFLSEVKKVEVTPVGEGQTKVRYELSLVKTIRYTVPLSPALFTKPS